MTASIDERLREVIEQFCDYGFRGVQRDGWKDYNDPAPLIALLAARGLAVVDAPLLLPDARNDISDGRCYREVDEAGRTSSPEQPEVARRLWTR